MSVWVGVFPMDVWRILLHYVIDDYKTEYNTYFTNWYHTDTGSLGLQPNDKYWITSFHVHVPPLHDTRSSIYMAQFLKTISLIHPKIRRLLRLNTFATRNKQWFQLRKLY